LLAAVCRCAFALNPSLEINRYAHKAWLSRDGYFRGTINSIAQTPEGYLWLGTDLGLLRFDGVRFTRFEFPEGQRLPAERISSLLSARDGTLWIGTRAGLASWKDGRLTPYGALEGRPIYALIEDREGRVWTGTTSARLCVIQGGRVTCEDEGDRFGRYVYPLGEDSRGDLWLGSAGGIWRWRPDKTKIDVAVNVIAFTEGDHGEVFFGGQDGLRRLAGAKVERYRVPGMREVLKLRCMFRDRDGGIWIGTFNEGLWHLHQGKWDHFQRSDGLSGDFVWAVFEDREGSVWAATSGGLDRFRAFAVPEISTLQGLSSPDALSVLTSRDGAVWIGTADGLNRWDNGQVTIYRRRNGLPNDRIGALFLDQRNRVWSSTTGGTAFFENGRFRPANGLVGGAVAQSMTGDAAGNIWISEVFKDGLLQVAPDGTIERTPWTTFGQDVGPATCLATDSARNGLWLGFQAAGVAFLGDGHVQMHYTSANGLGAGFVRSLRLEGDGVLWAATEGGLSRIKDGRIATLISKNGLPCDTVHWLVQDDDHAVWLYTACGLVRIPRPDLDAWAADSKRTVHTTLFDESDGVKSSAAVPVGPLVTRTADGKFWFVNLSGVSILDPRHLEFNKLPPPVHIEKIKADGKEYDPTHRVRLPAKVRDVWIDYTALSLVAPEKVRFKYMLEGQDRNWMEVVNDREAQYSNLPPRKYRFRVIASNNSGVWNETGDTLEFSIDPAYYQTTWFYALCVAAFLAMLWGLYWLRLYQVRREFNAQLDGRVEERMRVARELHDTLLQSFQASLIQMQAARNVLSRRPEKAEQSLDKAITTAAGAVAEGRSAIQDLRVQPAGGADLAELLTAAGQELAHSDEAQGNPPVFRVTVEGERRDLEPLLQDEVYRIARELLRNAVRHAQAGHIEAEIRYESRQLRVHVRDDGKGIDPEVLKAGGRAGHYGLPGMRERAGRFGGKLEFWSEAGAGTEAVLTVPAAAAYANSNGGAFSFLRRKLWIHER